MLNPGRIPMSEAEHAAVDALIEANPDVSIGLTRRDPEETGPLLATIGDTTHEIAEDGTVTDG